MSCARGWSLLSALFLFLQCLWVLFADMLRIYMTEPIDRWMIGLGCMNESIRLTVNWQLAWLLAMMLLCLKALGLTYNWNSDFHHNAVIKAVWLSSRVLRFRDRNILPPFEEMLRILLSIFFLSVCSLIISKTTQPNLAKVFKHVVCGRCSVLFWRHSDTLGLCISGSVSESHCHVGYWAPWRVKCVRNWRDDIHVVWQPRLQHWLER